MRLAVALSACLLVASPVVADEVPEQAQGRYLLNACLADDQAWEMFCEAIIIVGHQNRYDFIEVMRENPPLYYYPDADRSYEIYCVPIDIGIEIAKPIVVSFLKAHPERLDELASRVATDALKEAFPCEPV